MFRNQNTSSTGPRAHAVQRSEQERLSFVTTLVSVTALVFLKFSCCGEKERERETLSSAEQTWLVFRTFGSVTPAEHEEHNVPQRREQWTSVQNSDGFSRLRFLSVVIRRSHAEPGRPLDHLKKREGRVSHSFPP